MFSSPDGTTILGWFCDLEVWEGMKEVGHWEQVFGGMLPLASCVSLSALWSPT